MLRHSPDFFSDNEHYSGRLRGRAGRRAGTTREPRSVESGAVWAGEGAKNAPTPGRTHADFFIASLMTSAAVAEAFCKVAVVRCEYRCVTLLVLCPSICCTS